MMEHVTLTRMESSDEGTFGRINGPGISFYTGELPWRENQSNISCIPSGIYRCVYSYSPHFGRQLYEVEMVPGRFGIRIHSANFMGDKSLGKLCQLNGCIALSERRGRLEHQKALLVSASAVRRFESVLDYQPFILQVKNA